MANQVWHQVIEQSADPVRVRHGLERLQGTDTAHRLRHLPLDSARVLAALFSGSAALGDLLVAQPEWLPLILDTEALRFPRTDQGLRREVQSWLKPALAARDYAGGFSHLRAFKQRALLRIAARDLARLGPLSEILRELSDVADTVLETVLQLCWQPLRERLGEPWHEGPDGDWERTAFCVLGMGKLGGQELNYSSDVDLLFVYDEEGFLFKEPPRRGEQSGRGLPNHQFFKRLAEAFVNEVGRLASEGRLYRIDLRLRPEGQAGPLARSLAGYENYYAQWGQTWERMMLIKTRCVAGDPRLAGEFLEMVQPFRFPRFLGEQAVGEIAAMKQRIETEAVRSGELDRNIKLGRGGIREIEFIVQTLQVLHAGRIPFLADRQTLTTLPKLVRYQLLPGDIALDLAAAYEFLRDVEHRLQMENNLQTHSLPQERRARERIAALMGFSELSEFENALDAHRRRVRQVYEELIQAPSAETTPGLPPLQADDPAWLNLLTQHTFRDPAKALRLALAFVHGPGFGHVSARTEQAALQLLGRLLALCPQPGLSASDSVARFPDGDPQSRLLSDPDRVMARLDTFVAAYGTRAMLFETWTANPALFDLLVLLFDRSEFLAETAIRTPDMVDELEMSGYLQRTKSAEQTLRDLRYGLDDPDQRLWLRRYHQTELMRIGLRDILGLADFEQNLVELSALADACLQYALEVALRKHQVTEAPLAIVGLGKLGGAELNYGSDLDVVFIADDQVPDLFALQRVAVEVIDLISSPTEYGVAFEIDPRLRPDGTKGLLVNTLKAYSDYYHERGRLWEIQAISRSRFIAGNPAIGDQFRQQVGTLCDFSHPETAAAYQSDWREQIAQMRLRIEKERTPRGQDALAIKTGSGGLMDAEFAAQSLCLAHGWREANTLRALQHARERQAVPTAEADRLIENYRRLRRVEGILRRWSYEGETELPRDPAPLYRVAIRCGFLQAADFLTAVARYRQNIRDVCRQVLPLPAIQG